VPRARLILLLAIASQAAVSIVNFGLPAISAELQELLDVGPAGFGVVYAAVGLGATAGLMPAGVLVDRFGSRPLLAAGALLNLAGMLLAALADSLAPFAAALFVAGLGGAVVPVAGMAALLREFPPERRGSALGWRQLAVPLGGGVGAIALPALAGAGGVPLALLVTAALVVACSAAFAAVAGTEPAAGERRSLRLDGVLDVPGMRWLLAVGALYALALGVTLAYLVPAARDAGLTAGEAGIAFLALNVSAGASRVVWGRVADLGGGTRRLRTILEIGTLATAAALVMPWALHAGAVAAIVATAVLAFGAFGFNALVYLTAGEWAGRARAARAVGIAGTVVFGCGSIAAPIAGYAITVFGFDAVWVLAAAFAGLGVLATTRLARRTAGHVIGDSVAQVPLARATRPFARGR
jgi:MFS family permease